MPTYTYACKDCGERIEVVRSFSDDPLRVCPACDGTLRQVFKPAGIVFKGSGWHIKDYAGGGRGGGATDGGANGDGTSASSGSSTSTDSSTSGSSTSGSSTSSGSSGSGTSPAGSSSGDRAGGDR